MNFVKENMDGTYTTVYMNLDSKEAIEEYVNKEYKNPHSYMFSGWDSKLFSRPQDEIIDFLVDRFENTENPVEWMILLPYLKKIVSDRKLFKPFDDRKKLKGGILTHTLCDSFEHVGTNSSELEIIGNNTTKNNTTQTILEI